MLVAPAATVLASPALPRWRPWRVDLLVLAAAGLLALVGPTLAMRVAGRVAPHAAVFVAVFGEEGARGGVCGNAIALEEGDIVVSDAPPRSVEAPSRWRHGVDPWGRTFVVRVDPTSRHLRAGRTAWRTRLTSLGADGVVSEDDVPLLPDPSTPLDVLALQLLAWRTPLAVGLGLWLLLVWGYARAPHGSRSVELPLALVPGLPLVVLAVALADPGVLRLVRELAPGDLPVLDLGVALPLSVALGGLLPCLGLRLWLRGPR